MIIHVPGFGPRYVDEPAPTAEQKAEANPLPSVADAIRQANLRQTQVLSYTRNPSVPSPLVNGEQPGDPTSSGQTTKPHSVNDHPVVT
jgi:hypothetical protein